VILLCNSLFRYEPSFSRILVPPLSIRQSDHSTRFRSKCWVVETTNLVRRRLGVGKRVVVGSVDGIVRVGIFLKVERAVEFGAVDGWRIRNASFEVGEILVG